MILGHLAYILLAMNPIGGLPVAIPFAVLKLDYPGWLTFLIAVPCSYLQVGAVDAGWDRLNRWARWRALLERIRSPRIERLVESKGAFLPTALMAPMVGPWIVMAFMRYARVPQRQVALPIVTGIASQAVLLIVLCTYGRLLLHR